jgi:GTP-binding protein
MIVVSKWDLIEKDSSTEAAFTRQLRAQLKFLDYAPVVTVSALTGQRAVRVLALATEIQAYRQLRVPTSELNRLIADVQATHDIRRKGRELKIRYATQVSVGPPTFLFFVNDKTLIHFSHRRLLENHLRERFSFRGTSVRLVFRDSSSAEDDRS